MNYRIKACTIWNPETMVKVSLNVGHSSMHNYEVSILLFESCLKTRDHFNPKK